MAMLFTVTGLAYASLVLQSIGWVFLPLLFLPVIKLIWPNARLLHDICVEMVKLIDSFSIMLGEIIKWALPLLVITVAFSVFALSIFGLSWVKLFESAEYLHASTIMLGAAATLLAGKHVRVDIFYARMTPNSRAFTEFCGFYIFLLPMFLILLWVSQSFVAFSWLSFEGSSETGGIRAKFLLKTLIPIFSIMMLAQGMSLALRAAFYLRGIDMPKYPAHIDPIFTDQDGFEHNETRS